MSDDLAGGTPRPPQTARPRLSKKTLVALLPGLAVLLAAWLVPLPRMVLGEENLAPQRIPQTRATVERAGAKFRQAQSNYRAYVKSHDLAALLVTIQDDIKRARENSNDPQNLLALRNSATQVKGYVEVLHAYAKAGEEYFEMLRRYDDELMAWTRTLGATGEQVRRYTWPIADHLRLYPAPVGDIPDDIPWVTAAEVQTQTLSLTNHIAALSSDGNPNAPASSRQEAIAGISKDVADVWASGRSIEVIESHHNDYYKVLTIYYGHIANIVRTGLPRMGTTQVALATGANVLVAALTLVGLALFFAPRRAVPAS